MSNVKALPKTITVELGEEKFEIKKLPLGKYAELMLALRNMPTGIIAELQDMNGKSEDQLIATIFGVFGQAWGQVLDIISIGSGIDKDRIANDETIGLDGGIELFLAIFEVNNLGKVVTQVKNAINRPTK